MSYREEKITGKFDSFVNVLVQKTRATGHILTSHSFVVLTDKKAIAAVEPIDASTIIEGIDQIKPALQKLDKEYEYENN